MKLGIIADPVEQSFQMAQKKGLSFVEFCINIGQDCRQFSQRVEELEEYVKKYGVAVGSIGRWGSDKLDAGGTVIEEELQNNRCLIDAASRLGCKVFHTGVNFVEQLSYYENISRAMDYLQKLVEYGEQKGVRIAVYNCRWNNYICTPEQWKLVHGHLKQLGIKYDSSHCIYDGGDYLQEAKDWGSRFYHVHIKGALSIGGERFDDPPAGLDSTNWGAFFSVLYAVGYNGLLSIEPHSRVWRKQLGEKGLDYTIQYLRPMIL
ncbi:MAG: sugar phosphate isomerase/epimerase [Clostridiales bacterium]|jgi:sugar phosphate isomerase/epimerase|nr:sugar phosphate isomerase/epimerase [Clostridiales bacterium]